MKILKIFIGVVAGVVTVMGVLSVGLYIFFPKGGYGVSTSPEVVQLEIGDKLFAIPKNHIWSRAEWKGGKTDGVNMYALLPDFEGRTKENTDLFKFPQSRRKISILVDEHNIPDSRTSKIKMTRQLIYERIKYDSGTGKPKIITDYPGPFGLTRQVFTPTYTKGKDFFVGRKKDDSLYWVRCSVEGRYPTPSCKTSVGYSDYVAIDYSFPKRYLNQWHAIDDQVLAFIHSFEINHLNKDANHGTFSNHH